MMTSLTYTRGGGLEREEWNFFLDGTVLRCSGYQHTTRPTFRHKNWNVVACSGNGRRHEPGYTEKPPLTAEVAAEALAAFRASLTVSSNIADIR